MPKLDPQLARRGGCNWVINHPREAIAHWPSNHGLFIAADMLGIYRPHWSLKSDAQDVAKELKKRLNINVQVRDIELTKEQVRQQSFIV